MTGMARVLIAEDEPNIASFVEKGLVEHGHAVTVIDDGLGAATMARSDDFDLLILDLGLPKIDGFEVLRRLRGRGERLPVIVLSSALCWATVVLGQLCAGATIVPLLASSAARTRT